MVRLPGTTSATQKEDWAGLLGRTWTQQGHEWWAEIIQGEQCCGWVSWYWTPRTENSKPKLSPLSSWFALWPLKQNTYQSLHLHWSQVLSVLQTWYLLAFSLWKGRVGNQGWQQNYHCLWPALGCSHHCIQKRKEPRLSKAVRGVDVLSTFACTVLFQSTLTCSLGAIHIYDLKIAN